MPEKLHHPSCCAEFMVNKDRVLSRPLQFYQNALRVMKVLMPNYVFHSCEFDSSFQV